MSRFFLLISRLMTSEKSVLTFLEHKEGVIGIIPDGNSLHCSMHSCTIVFNIFYNQRPTIAGHPADDLAPGTLNSIF